VRQIKYLQAT